MKPMRLVFGFTVAILGIVQVLNGHPNSYIVWAIGMALAGTGFDTN